MFCADDHSNVDRPVSAPHHAEPSASAKSSARCPRNNEVGLAQTSYPYLRGRDAADLTSRIESEQANDKTVPNEAWTLFGH